jgi:hypothetical protein
MMDKKRVWIVSGQLILIVATILFMVWIVRIFAEERVKADAGLNLQFVSGTEYVGGDEGQVAVIITNSSGTVVTPAFMCNATVLYPNKSIMLEENMSNITGVGTRYIVFVVPDVFGVYEYTATCVSGSIGATAAHSFHVSSGNDLLLNATKRPMRAVVTQ